MRSYETTDPCSTTTTTPYDPHLMLTHRIRHLENETWIEYARLRSELWALKVGIMIMFVSVGLLGAALLFRWPFTFQAQRLAAHETCLKSHSSRLTSC